jgi:hypothetical protein
VVGEGCSVDPWMLDLGKAAKSVRGTLEHEKLNESEKLNVKFYCQDFGFVGKGLDLEWL